MKILLRSLSVIFILLFSTIQNALAAGIPMHPYRGNYFSVQIPGHWQVNESMNGIDIVAQDRVTGNSFIILLGAFGRATPEGFLRMRLQQGPYSNVRVIKINPLPDQPGPMGINWKVIEAWLQFNYQGVTVRAHVVSAIAQGYNQYSAVLRAYQAPVQYWERMRGDLARIDDSIRIINASGIAGSPQQYLPKGTRHDDVYGGYNKAYQDRQRSSDRNSQARREGTMGQVRMKDPKTGKIYDMPIDSYDPSFGGYRNPVRPTERLIKAAPGE